MRPVRLLAIVSVMTLGGAWLPAAAGTASAPTVSKVSPNYGPARGGTTVTVTGTHLDSATAVRFGGKDSRFHRVSSTELRATTPPHAKGAVVVTVVTKSGRGVDKSGYLYATRTAPPIGAGYLVPHSDARSGTLRLVVPHLTCRPHENSTLGATVQDVVHLDAGDRWAASVSFQCLNGVAKYHTFLRCGYSSNSGPKPSPGDRVELSYGHNSNFVQVDSRNSSVGFGCARVTNRPRNEPQVAFLVRTASHPPAALRSLKVHVSVAGGKLSAAHPTRQRQAVTTQKQLRAGSIASDGKTFTVRLQYR